MGLRTAKEPAISETVTLAPRVVGPAATRAALPFGRLIAALHDAFIAGAEAPLRHRHQLPGGTLLLMPAWSGEAIGVKIVTVFPENGRRDLPSVSSTYLLSDGATGRTLAIIDGTELTGRRTAAASALAGRFLARPDAASLLIVGAGHIAGLMADAWSAVRPIRQVRVWNRTPSAAEELAARLRAAGHQAVAVGELEPAVGQADIVSCATLSRVPLIRGAWLRRGTHLDLIGGYAPDMREADDDAIGMARVVIDGPAALTEAGDITQAVSSGALNLSDIAGTLTDLCRGAIAGRTDPNQITLFKSVGTALEDLAAALLVYGAAP